MEIIDFVECYANQIKDGTYVVTNLDAEISIYIQIIIPVKTSFYLQGIQQSSLTTKVTIWKIRGLRKNCLYPIRNFFLEVKTIYTYCSKCKSNLYSKYLRKIEKQPEGLIAQKILKKNFSCEK